MSAFLDRPVKVRNFMGVTYTRRYRNFFATGLISGCMLLTLMPLVWITYSVIRLGWSTISSWTWWTHSQAGMTSFIAGGGVYHAIVGTLLQALVCAGISIPIGITTAIYLVEYSSDNWMGRLTSLAVDVLSGLPSIVAALFIYALWVATLGFERSGFAVSLALATLMIPVISRVVEEILWTIPVDLREASYALGIPKWKTITRILLPEVISGIVTGIIVALARIMGETAPVLVLVGYTQVINMNIFHGFMGSLTGMIYDQTSLGAGISTIPTQRLWGTAVVLFLLVAALNLLARIIGGLFRSQYIRGSGGQTS